MYLENSVKAALGLIGHPDPSLALVQERVKAIGYKGYVAADFVLPPAPKRTRKPKVVKEDA
jgi:hypothetical protein